MEHRPLLISRTGRPADGLAETKRYGRRPDRRRQPLEITQDGRRRLAVLRREIRPMLENSRALLTTTIAEVYGDHGSQNGESS